MIVVGAADSPKKVKLRKGPTRPLSTTKKEKLVTPMRQGMDANQQRQTSSGAKPLSPTRLEAVTSIPTHVSAGRREPRTCSKQRLEGGSSVTLRQQEKSTIGNEKKP